MRYLPQRKSIRLKNYDYSQPNLYFITICTQNRECLFGEIANRKMILNNVGKMTNKWFLKIPDRFKNIMLNTHQIMPNHLHGIVVVNDGGQTHVFAPTRGNQNHVTNSVGADPCVGPFNPGIVRRQQLLFKTIQWFKTMVTNQYIRNVKNKNWVMFNKRIFQRNYYEHIIRNETELNNIRKYIIENPENWENDKNNLI